MDARTRIARSVTLRLEALWRGRQLEDKLNLARTSAARISEILAVAQQKDFMVVAESRATPPAIEEALPWGARLYEEILGDKQLGYGVGRFRGDRAWSSGRHRAAVGGRGSCY